jgi:hypothetical protein
MHQARALTASIAQDVQHAVDVARGAGTALDAKPDRLVEDENVVILIKRDRAQKLTRLFFRLGKISRFRRIEPERRDAHRLACLQPVLSIDPLAVDAQFAFADHALDVGERQRRKSRLEKAVDPHAGFIGGDHDGLDFGGFLGKRNWRDDLPHG